MIARLSTLLPLSGAALVALHAAPLWLARPTGAAEHSARLDAQLVARLPDTATGMGAATEAGWLYLLGGHRGEAHHYADALQSADFLRLDLADLRTFERLPGLELGVQGAQLAAFEGGVWRTGGMRARNAVGEESELVSLDEVARFDVRSGTWGSTRAMPGRRSSHAAAVVGGVLFLVGGWDIAGAMGRDSTFCATTWTLDLGVQDAQWNALETPFRRRAMAVAALEGALVALGGMDETGAVRRETFVLDTTSGTWSEGPPLPEPGFGAAAVGSGGRAWASCGEGTLWSWAPGEEDWRAEGRQLFGRLFGQLVARAEGELLCVGGTCRGTQVRAVERLRLRGAERAPAGAIEASLAAPAPSASHLRVASPGRARNRQAAALVGDRLLLFGGNASLGQHDFAPENFLDEGWALDLRSLEWEPLRDLPVRRQSMRTVEIDSGAVLALGGFGHDGEGTRSFSDVFRYSSKADVWKQLPGLPANRTQFAVVRDGDDLWLLGGLDYREGRASGSDFVHATEVWRASLAGDGEPRFEPTGIELPVGRRAFGCAVLGRSIYVVGGMTDGFERLEECLEIDLDSGEVREFPAPRAQRISPDLVALDGRLVLVGGASARGGDGSGSDRSIEVYDPQTRSWSVWTEDFGIEPAHVSAYAHRGRLLLTSTQTADPAAIDLVWLDPGTDSRP